MVEAVGMIASSSAPLTVRPRSRVVALILTWVAVVACGHESVPAARAAVALPTVLVETMTVSTPLSLTSQLFVERDAVVAARASGMLERLGVDLGVRVAAGEPIGQVESAGQAIALDQATAARDLAGRAATRARALSKTNGVTPAELEQLELQHAQAELAVRKARRDLELTRVVAPFAGIVTARYVRAPRLIVAGDTLVRIAELSPLLARVRIPEHAATAVRVGEPAVVKMLDGGSVSAHVARLSPAFDPASGTREAVLQVEGGSLLLPGASVQVRLGRQQRRVLVVPRSAVSAGGFVLVVDRDRTTMRAVTLGEELEGGRVEVSSGLAIGERIVRSPPS